MDLTRLSVLIALAGGALVDILIAVYLILAGALDFAVKQPLNPKSIAILFLIAACFVAPPMTLSFFRKNNYLYAFIAVCAPMTLAALGSRFGL
ncbi:MAG TPA: hypothetical protein VJL90_12435 [Pseudorhodoplanes sp.]|nr:hypothetical protein [Pseudorhodoplanes sp.]